MLVTRIRKKEEKKEMSDKNKRFRTAYERMLFIIRSSLKRQYKKRVKSVKGNWDEKRKNIFQGVVKIESEYQNLKSKYLLIEKHFNIKKSNNKELCKILIKRYFFPNY